METKLVTTRDVYLPELSSGNVDIVPDYLAGITDYLNTEERSRRRAGLQQRRGRHVAALEPLAEEQGIADPAAESHGPERVLHSRAPANGLTTAVRPGRTRQADQARRPAGLRGRADCEGGLTDVYGLDITEIVPLDFGSSQVKDAVAKGEVDLGETGTTDASLAELGLVLLEDDKGIQPAQNLTPAVNAEFLADNPDLEDLFNELSAALTTEDLAAMNLKVDLERQKPEDVAQQFLEDKGLSERRGRWTPGRPDRR